MLSGNILISLISVTKRENFIHDLRCLTPQKKTMINMIVPTV